MKKLLLILLILFVQQLDAQWIRDINYPYRIRPYRFSPDSVWFTDYVWTGTIADSIGSRVSIADSTSRYLPFWWNGKYPLKSDTTASTGFATVYQNSLKQNTIPNLADTSKYWEMLDSINYYKRLYIDALLSAKQSRADSNSPTFGFYPRQQSDAQLNSKAPIESPIFTGNVGIGIAPGTSRFAIKGLNTSTNLFTLYQSSAASPGFYIDTNYSMYYYPTGSCPAWHVIGTNGIAIDAWTMFRNTFTDWSWGERSRQSLALKIDVTRSSISRFVVSFDTTSSSWWGWTDYSEPVQIFGGTGGGTMNIRGSTWKSKIMTFYSYGTNGGTGTVEKAYIDTNGAFFGEAIYGSDTVKAGTKTSAVFTYFIPGGDLVKSSSSALKTNITEFVPNLSNYKKVTPKNFNFKKELFLETFDEKSIPDSVDIEEHYTERQPSTDSLGKLIFVDADKVRIKKVSNKANKDSLRTEFYYQNNKAAEGKSKIMHVGIMADDFGKQILGKDSVNELRNDEVTAVMWLKIRELEAKLDSAKIEIASLKK